MKMRRVVNVEGTAPLREELRPGPPHAPIRFVRGRMEEGERNQTVVTFSCGHKQELPWGTAVEVSKIEDAGSRGPGSPEVWQGPMLPCEECEPGGGATGGK